MVWFNKELHWLVFFPLTVLLYTHEKWKMCIIITFLWLLWYLLSRNFFFIQRMNPDSLLVSMNKCSNSILFTCMFSQILWTSSPEIVSKCICTHSTLSIIRQLKCSPVVWHFSLLFYNSCCYPLTFCILRVRMDLKNSQQNSWKCCNMCITIPQ